MKQLLTLLLLANATFLTAQSIGAYVISPAGATFKSEGVQLQFSLGEPMNTLIDSSGMVISQGLLQTAVEPISTSIPTLNIEKIDIYPNPFIEQLTIDANFEKEKLTYQLRPINGATVLQGDLEKGTQIIPTKGLVEGIYILTITSPKLGLSKTILVVKS